MGEVRRIVIPYAPRREQLAIHHLLERHRFGVVVCHRRFGKTVLAVNHLLRQALTCPREAPRVAYVAPTYRQAKAIAWDYVRRYAEPVLGRQFNEQELRADFPNGGRLRLFGADSPDALRGIYLDAVVLDEYGLMQERVWSEILRPALADRGGSALFIGTPNGRNHFAELRDMAARGLPGWFLRERKASETALIAQRELDDSRRVMTKDEYAQEWECSFEASVRGAIYAEQITQAHVAPVPYAPELPVQTFWDLGVGDATAIWFAQVAGAEVRLMDYYEASGEGLPHYAQVLKDRGYVYGAHWAPHDISVRELGSGRSRLETAQALGIRFRVVPQLSLEDGIHAARVLLPRCWFDAERCFAGLDALKGYRWERNERLAEYKATPVHDKYSHGADAFRYLALALKEPKSESAQKQRLPLVSGAWMG